ncbi:DUF4386 domain-containing protein [Streptomyces sp. PmtG]
MVRRAGTVAGAGLLLMAMLALFAQFGVLERLVSEGDATKTARDVLDSETLFQFGVVCLALVAVLDVVVAWALLVFFRPVHEGVALLAALFRVAYAGVFLAAIGQLAGVVPLLGDTERLAAYGPHRLNSDALLKITSFSDIWSVGLILFGVHLILLGYLAYASGRMPRLIGALLAVAGLGYLVDSLGLLLDPEYSADVARFTAVGEVVLMVWLLVKGRTSAPGPRQRPPGP